MANGEKGSNFSRKIKQRLTGADRSKLQMEEMRRRQKVDEQLRVEQDHVVVEIQETGPFHIVHLSDIHFGHDSVDYDYLDQVIQYILDTPGVYVMFYGDLIEGFKKDYADTNTQHLYIPVEQQIIMLRDRYLKPLYEKGKILSMVSRFTQSHDGWPLKESNMDIYPLLTMDMDNLGLVGNGGITEVVAKDENDNVVHTVKIRCFHNSPKAGNEMAPVSGLRNSEAPLPGYVDMVVAGDRHTLGGSHAMEKDADGNITIYIQIPPFKGNLGGEIPDRLMQAKYGNRKFAPGGSSTIHEIINKKPYIHSVRDLEEASNRDRIRRLGDALDADPAAKDEIMDAIEKRPTMAVNFNPEKSRKRVQEDSRNHRSYVKTWHDILNVYYLALFTAPGFRVGSGSENKKREAGFVETVSSIDNHLTILGAENLDRSVVSSSAREAIVDRYTRLVGQVNPIIQVNDSVWRHEGWKKPVTRDGASFMPGTYIQDELGVVLVDNEGEMFLAMKDENGRTKHVWSGLLLDGTGSGGPPKDPYRMGVSTELEKFSGEGNSHDLVIGSRSSKAGVQSRFNPKTGEDQLFIAPGRIANESVVGGKGRSSRTAEGGLGAFLTIWGEAYPFMTLEEAAELDKDFPTFAYLMMRGTLNNVIKGIEKSRKGRR